MVPYYIAGDCQYLSPRLLIFALDIFSYLGIPMLSYWRRKWQPTPVFLPGETQGRGSLVGCRLWDRTELDTTEVT